MLAKLCGTNSPVIAVFCGLEVVSAELTCSLLFLQSKLRYRTSTSTGTCSLREAKNPVPEPIRVLVRCNSQRQTTTARHRHHQQSTIGHQDQFAERKSCSFDKGIKGLQSSALSTLRRESSHLLRPLEYGRAGKGRSRCAVEARHVAVAVWRQWVPSPLPSLHYHPLPPSGPIILGLDACND